MVYTHVYLNTLLLLHLACMLSVVKMPLKGKVEIVMEITLLIMENHRKNHGICVFEFLWDHWNEGSIGECDSNITPKQRGGDIDKMLKEAASFKRLGRQS